MILHQRSASAGGAISILKMAMLSVSTFMSQDVATVTAETSLAKSAREMLRNRIHHLPVVDHRDHLIGIISTMDILAEFADGEVD